MLKIDLPEFSYENYNQIYVGNRPRYATASGVVFIDQNTILVCSYLNKMLYLIKLLDNSYEIISSLEIEYFPDLIDYKDGMIVASHVQSAGFQGRITLYKLEDTTISYLKTIILERIFPHGCTFLNSEIVIISSPSSNIRGCVYLNINTEEYTLFDKIKFYPKDAYCISDERILVVTSKSRPSSIPVKVQDSLIYLINPKNNKIIRSEIIDSQTDSVTLCGEHGFITLQGDDAIVYFKYKNDKISVKKTIYGFSFPHGAGAFGNKVAITNYGNNSVYIFDINELISSSIKNIKSLTSQ